jgi:hypothetical protein
MKTVKYSTGENWRAKRVAHEERIDHHHPEEYRSLMMKAVVSASVARPCLG